MGIRCFTVVRGDRLAWLDFTNRPVIADRTRVTKRRLGCLRAMARGYQLRATANEDGPWPRGAQLAPAARFVSVARRVVGAA